MNFALVLLGAAVLSVPIARRLGLSAIVAYLLAGIIIGPYGLAAFGTPERIIPVSELGIVMLLFPTGLELELGGGHRPPAAGGMTATRLALIRTGPPGAPAAKRIAMAEARSHERPGGAS